MKGSQVHDVDHYQLYRPKSETIDPVIELVNIEYYYANGKQALKNLTTTIYEGDRLAIVGHNGSGKTTLAKILTGIYEPSAGNIIFRGNEKNLNIGMVFQDPDDQLFSATLFDDLAFGLLNRGIPEDQAKEKVFNVLKLLNLEGFAYKEPHNMSYGQKKRAALASVLVLEPDILILDEPTAGLDPENEEELLEFLNTFDGTLICISHNLFFLYHLCERALVLKNGSVHHDFTMNELLSHRSSLKEHGLDFTFRFSCCEVNGEHENVISQRQAENVPLREQPDLIEVRNLTYSYPDGSVALNGVSFKIGYGERVAIVGENGAGKTTLALLLAGVLNGDGKYFFRGTEVSEKLRRNLWQHIGLIFQNPMDQLFCASCYEEVAFGPKNLGLTNKDIEEIVKRSLGMVGLDGFEGEIPHKLSGGEQKRLATASVLSMSPDVLILDEPTNNLDPAGEEKLINILDEIDKTLIIISHDLCFLSFLCDRALVLHKGELIADMSLDELIRSEAEKLKLHHHHHYHHRCCTTIREIFFGLKSSGHHD